MKGVFRIKITLDELSINIDLKNIHLLCALFVILTFNYCCFSFIQIPYLKPTIAGISLVFWFFVSIKNRDFVKKLLPCLVCVGVLLIQILVVYWNESCNRAECLKDIYNLGRFTIILMFFLYYRRLEYSAARCFIIRWWSIDVLVSGLWTIYSNEQYPIISRLLSTGQFDYYIKNTYGDIFYLGIMSFAQIYELIFVVIGINYICAHYRKNLKVLWLANIFLIYLVIKAKFTIGILLMFLGVALVWLFKFYNPKYLTMYCCTTFMLFIFVILCITIGVEYSLFPSEITIRLMEIKNFMLGNDITNTDLMARLSLYFVSLENFADNLFMGGLSFEKVNIGGHSELFDLLAKYGWFYVVVFSLLWKFLYSSQVKLVGKKQVRVLRIAYSLLFMLYCCNTAMWSPINIGIVLILPFLISAFFENNDSNILTDRKLSNENIIN